MSEIGSLPSGEDTKRMTLVFGPGAEVRPEDLMTDLERAARDERYREARRWAFERVPAADYSEQGFAVPRSLAVRLRDTAVVAAFVVDGVLPPADEAAGERAA